MRPKEQRTLLMQTQPSSTLRETMCTQRKRKSTSFRLFASFHDYFWQQTCNFKLSQCYYMICFTLLIILLSSPESSCLNMLVFKAFADDIAFSFCNQCEPCTILDYFHFSFMVPKCCTFFCFSSIAYIDFFFYYLLL